MDGIDYKELKESFVTSSLSIIQKSESCVLILESSIDKVAIDELFRGIHTIKGNSGIFELQKIPHLSHAFENVLNLLRNSQILPTPGLIDIMLLGLDRLKGMISNLDMSDLVEVEDLVVEFNAFLGQDKKKTELFPDSNVSIQQVKWMEHIKVSDKIIEIAKSENKFLSIVIFNLCEQEFNTITEFLGKIKIVLKKNRILRKGIVTKKINDLENIADLYFPYYIIFLSDLPIESFLKEVGIKTEFVTTVFVPDNTEYSEENSYEKKDTVNSNPSPTKEEPVQDTSISVNLNLLNRLINLTGEIVLSRNILSLKIEQSGNSELFAISKRFENLLSELETGILKTRLQSMNSFFQKIPRLIRDISKSTGKQVEVKIEGGNVELDKSLIDELSDPVTHIIRNAIDHGIENLEDRQRKGKNPIGKINISARLRGGNVELTIGDDGKGLNIAKIRQKIIQKKLAPPEQIEKSSESAILDYLFMPGFSTAQEVTELSGRGVGLDVVRSNLKKIGGTVSIDFKEDSGTIFILSIPQTLSIVKCLILKSGNRKFAIPQQYLSELIRIIPERIKLIDNKPLYDLRNELLPIVKLSSLFNLSADLESEKFIIALKSENFYFAISATEILDTEEIVVKPLGEYFEELGFFAGATVLGDGDIALILDVSGVARLSAIHNSQALIESRKEIAEIKVKENYLLFSVDSTWIAMSIESNPYIVRISINEIFSYLGIDMFMHNKESVPILWLNEVLRIDMKRKDFDLFNIILYKNSNGYIGIAATFIEGVINDLENVHLEKIMGKGIIGTGFKDDHNVILLDVAFLLEEFYQQKLKNVKLNIDYKELLSGA